MERRSTAHTTQVFEGEEMNIFNDMLNSILTVNERLADEPEPVEVEDDLKPPAVGWTP